MQKSNPDLQKITDLLSQLETVQTFASCGFWLNTFELAQLLGFPPYRLYSLEKLQIGYELPWRNFICCLVEEQGGQQLWQITRKNSTARVSQSLPHQNLQTLPEADKNIQVIPAVFAKIDNFLPKVLLNRLLRYVLDNQSKFQTFPNSQDDANYQESWVLYQFPELSETILKYVHSLIPHVQRSLKIPAFEVASIESQLTARTHSDYYKPRNDNGSPDTATRELTYIYSFYQEPKQFAGGEILIYDGVIRNNFFDRAGTHKTYSPSNNTIIFFPSLCVHEGLPVSCPSQKFADSYFTVNGWVRRKEQPPQG